VCLADPLATAHAADAPIGIVGLDFPLDIAASEQRVFCHLPWRSGRSTPQADAWLEPAFPGWARSILQDWAEGRFAAFESVVFSRGDDAAQRLYYYICELQRRGLLDGPRALILDVAAIPRAGSVQHSARALRTLLTELDLGIDCLASGIARANRQRAVFARLESARYAPGHLYENIARAALYHDPLPVLEDVQLRPSTAEFSLYLAGSAPPDDTLHRTAEARGWNIVGEMHARSLLRHGTALQAGADPVLELATRLNANAYGSRAFVDRAAMLRAELARTGADAAVFWLTREDEARPWDLASQREACALAGKPCLALTQADWEFRDGAVDQLARFLEGIPT
jgi:hypothetical protein